MNYMIRLTVGKRINY